MSYGTKEWSEINSGKDDELNNLRYELFHITAERDELERFVDEQKIEIERLKEYINKLHKSISKI